MAMTAVDEKVFDFNAKLGERFGEEVTKSCKAGHSDYVSREHFENDCPECCKEREQEDQKTAQEKRHALILAGRWQASGMPKKFCGITLDDWKTSTAGQECVKAAAKAFVDGEVKRMLMIGVCGTGKTMLAAGIIGAMALKPNGKMETGAYADLSGGCRKISPVYITATRLVRSIRDTWTTKDMSEQEAMDRFINADVLVVDELGAGRCSEDDKLMLSEILCDRYSADMPTLLISNMTGEQIKADVLDERAVDRMREGGKIVTLKWKSRRGAVA